jgi:hypothetical protein
LCLTPPVSFASNALKNILRLGFMRLAFLSRGEIRMGVCQFHFFRFVSLLLQFSVTPALRLLAKSGIGVSQFRHSPRP